MINSPTARKMQTAALALAALLLAAGCHHTKQIATTQPPATDTDTETVTAPKHCEYTAINFTGEAAGLSVNGQLRVAKDSAMWLSVSKIVEVARALATQDSVWLRAPMMGIDTVADYNTLSQRMRRRVTYADLQDIALDDNAEERIVELARLLGFDAKVRFTQRRRLESLTFPYPKKRTP